MDRNNNILDTDKTDFECLLDELITASSTDNGESCFEGDDIEQVFVPYWYNGFEYTIPYSKSTKYCAKDIILNINGQIVLCNSAFHRLYEANSFNGIFNVMLENVETAKARGDNHITIALYRELQKEPLAWLAKQGEDDNMYFDFAEIIQKLPIGCYFLLISNLKIKSILNNAEKWLSNSYIKLNVLPKGEKMKHPEITQVAVNKQSNSLICSGGVDFCFDTKQKLCLMDEYSFYCYNSSLRLMGHENVYPSVEGNRREISFTMSSDLIWLPDEYFIIVSHNGEPFCKYSFTLTMDDAINGSSQLIRKNSADYILVKHLELECNNWAMFNGMLGVSAEKRMLLAHYNRVILNDRRRECGLNAIEHNYNYRYITNREDTCGNALRLFSDELTSFSSFRYFDCAQLIEPKNALDPYEEMNELLDNMDKSTVCLANLMNLIGGGIGKTLVQKLERKMNVMKNYSLILVGTESEINQLFEVNPSFARFFPNENTIVSDKLSSNEIIHYLFIQLKRLNLIISAELEHKLAMMYIEASKNGHLNNWCMENILDFINNGVLKNYQERVICAKSLNSSRAKLLLTTLKETDINADYFRQTNSSFEKSMKSLNAMVGLKNVKGNMVTAFNRMKFNEERRLLGLTSSNNVVHHMIFTGNPGTGKTTVAKMVGSIYHSLGLLSKGDVIVTERSQMVGRYIGETEKNMQAILNQAKGNVLFIDEAYTLCDNADDRKDFGCRALECLLTVLAQKNPDMLVIMAGYDKEMERMLDLNPGFRGRFPNKFSFEDYTASELMEIAIGILNEEEYILSAEANRCLMDIISKTVSSKDPYFSNARWIEQLVRNGIIPAMADRMMCNRNADRLAYQMIEIGDVEIAFQSFVYKGNATKSFRAIGFRA